MRDNSGWSMRVRDWQEGLNGVESRRRPISIGRGSSGRRYLHHRAVVLAVAAMALTSMLHAQPAEQDNKGIPRGQMSGSVEIPPGKSVEAVVVWTRAESLALSSKASAAKDTGTAALGSDGKFDVSGLEDGVYAVCVQAPGSDLLDPCEWDQPLRVEIRDGKSTNKQELKLGLKQGTRLRLEFDDPIKRSSSEIKPENNVSIHVGLWSPQGRYISLLGSSVSADKNAFEIAVPAETRLRFQIQVINGGFDLAADDGHRQEIADVHNQAGFEVTSAQSGKKTLRFVVTH